jgi:Ca-activated chloride channel family protein
MTFLSPAWLALLLPLAALAGTYLVLQRRRRHHAVRFTNIELLDSVAPSRPGWRRHLPAGAAALGLIALVMAMAGPVRDRQVPKDTATVMLVLDTSISMAADDVAPSRIVAAQDAASTFVGALPDTFDVGLVSFDGTARLDVAPTQDHDAVDTAIARFQLGEGTAAGDALTLAVDAVEASLAPDEVVESGDETAEAHGSDDADEPAAEVVPATVVLLSDGESTMGSPLEAGTEAALEAGIPVTTIAYGSPEGTVVVQGERVQVPADVDSMAAVAEATGGQAFTAGSAEQLASVLDDIETRIGTETEQQEIDAAFVAAGLLAVRAAVGGSMIWNGRFL